MEITKEVLLSVIELVLFLKDYTILQILTGKCFLRDEVEDILFFEKEKYWILGACVIKSDIIESSLNSKDSNFIEHILPIRNQEEFDSFLKFFTDKKEDKERIQKNLESSTDSKIKETISKYIENKEQQNLIFSIVKESSDLSNEDLLTKMDIVYKIVNSQQVLTDIFKANPKIKVNKNTYCVKDRN